MLYTNEIKHGGCFHDHFACLLNEANDVSVATGYFGTKLIEELTPQLTKVANRGRCRLLFGMVFHSGLSDDQKKALDALDNEIRKGKGAKGSGVFISIKPYHGKIYKINNNIFIGSSNFSVEGFKSRWEANSSVTDPQLKATANQYLDFLFSEKTTVDLGEVLLSGKRHIATPPSKFLEDYRFDGPLPGPVVGSMNIALRVDDQPASSLNLFFEPGRKNRLSGLYQSRPWYEVEITTASSERKNHFYPKTIQKKSKGNSRTGWFYAFILEDGLWYRIKIEVCSDGGKALMSGRESGGRETLGRIIKGKLEMAGVLRRGELITSDTLAAYGRDYLTLRKINDKNYILEF